MTQTANVARYVQERRSHGSDSLTKREDLRLPADDFKPGSHLEAGELVKRRICPFGEIGSGGATTGYALTLSPKPARESSVDPRYGLEFLPSGSGMSEYPAPTYPEQKWVVDSAQACKVS